MIVTDRGKAVMALVPVANADLETVSLSTDRRFMALIERSRARYKVGAGIRLDQLQRQGRAQEVPAPGLERRSGVSGQGHERLDGGRGRAGQERHRLGDGIARARLLRHASAAAQKLLHSLVDPLQDRAVTALAPQSLRRWWRLVGRRRYPRAKALLLCADGGGSTGSRNRAGHALHPDWNYTAKPGSYKK